MKTILEKSLYVTEMERRAKEAGIDIDTYVKIMENQ